MHLEYEEEEEEEKVDVHAHAIGEKEKISMKNNDYSRYIKLSQGISTGFLEYSWIFILLIIIKSMDSMKIHALP